MNDLQLRTLRQALAEAFADNRQRDAFRISRLIDAHFLTMLSAESPAQEPPKV